MGTLTVSKGALVVSSEVPKMVPSANLRLLAVVARNEPPIFNEALGPKIMPFGLSRNRFAPLAWIKPLILEIDPPVTRVRIF